MGIVINLEEYKAKREADLQIEYPEEFDVEEELAKIKIDTENSKDKGE